MSFASASGAGGRVHLVLRALCRSHLNAEWVQDYRQTRLFGQPGRDACQGLTSRIEIRKNPSCTYTPRMISEMRSGLGISRTSE